MGLIAFMTLDLGFYGLSYFMPPWNIYRIEDYITMAPPPPHELAASERPSRIYFNEHPAACVDCTHVDGYAKLMPARQLDYLRLETLQVAAADWVRRNKENEVIAGLRDRGGDWLEIPDPLPAVRLASRAQPRQRSGQRSAQHRLAARCSPKSRLRWPRQNRAA